MAGLNKIWIPGGTIVWQLKIDWLSEKLGLLPCLTFCECSVGPLEVAEAPGFVGKCDRMLLIEPEPHQAREAQRVLGTKVLQVAVGMQAGKQKMVYNNGSSYLKDTWAPNPTSQREFEVDVVTFDTIDDGQIDILNLDCEGQEWAVLSKMTSEPKLMSIEVDEYNPHRGQILQWLNEHDYILRFLNGPRAQTQLYTKKGL